MAGLMDAWKNMRIKTKILIMYLTVVLLSFVITFSVISVINTSYTKREIMGAGTQTVSALKGNLSLIFDNVTQFSNLIYFDRNVQEALRNVDNRAIDPSIQRTIKQSLVNMILSGEYISSVLIMDSYHNVYSSYKKTPKGIYGEKILESEWYRHLSEHRGNGFFMKGSEGVIEFYGDTPYITYIREIRDENTYKPLAILLVTVNEETIRNYFNGVSNSSDSDFYILGDEGEYIVAPGNPGQQTGENRLVITQDIGIENWKLAGSFQLDNMTAMAPYYSTIILLIMCMNVAFVFVCSVMLTRFIFHPLLKVEKHMMLVEKGQFDEMEVDRQKNEINNLKRVFNHMARSIKSLIQKVKEEEQIIAKVELDLLQAQINPHFLYNTLDAVSALALMRDYDNCFKMTQALGSFYRNSLNSGLDFITVKDEISCIQSYLTILNIRYDNEIKVEVDVEEEVKDCRILKLLLQPLVENAVHHGIKPREGKGTISIKAFSDEDEIIFLVSDDGVGMSEEKIEEIMEGKTVTGKSGFGLYNLKQRITLYHGIRQPVLIHSEIGNGTEIAVRVKRMEAKGLEHGDQGTDCG
ncbi:sensor histidine kinase [Clostridium sp. WB02_MRS01]|uniref:cache domain-containing sensor histidine kinase n=1 Tax=Clostridium sp. WB02_MRS01 TaxID=2605777 RepID=UPI0012B221BF|nr:sensor histidine kinase [Clostridium sp. WB02_MRS01]MSS08832.1 sensor histidine kinase [Clostridium sp. WB02_MRS01]